MKKALPLGELASECETERASPVARGLLHCDKQRPLSEGGYR